MKGPGLYILPRTWLGKKYSHLALQTARKQRVATSPVSLLSHPALSHLEAWDEARSRFLFSLYPTLRGPRISRRTDAARMREVKKGDVTGETNLRPARETRQTGIGARRL